MMLSRLVTGTFKLEGGLKLGTSSPPSDSKVHAMCLGATWHFREELGCQRKRKLLKDREEKQRSTKRAEVRLIEKGFWIVIVFVVRGAASHKNIFMKVCIVQWAQPRLSACVSPLVLHQCPVSPRQFCFFFHIIYTWILYTCVMSRNYTCCICVPEMDVIHLNDNLQVYDFHCVRGPRFLYPFLCCGILWVPQPGFCERRCSGHRCARIWHTMDWLWDLWGCSQELGVV